LKWFKVTSKYSDEEEEIWYSDDEKYVKEYAEEAPDYLEHVVVEEIEKPPREFLEYEIDLMERSVKNWQKRIRYYKRLLDAS
jgi:hypothetical protein